MLARAITEVKCIKIGKEEIKLSLLTDVVTLYIDYVTLYTDYTNESRRKQLKLRNEFSKAVGYKINTQKSAVFLCSSNEQSKNEIKKAVNLQ